MVLFRWWCVVLLCLPSVFALAQTGNPFITNYQLTNTIVDNQNWSIVQGNDEVMLFANRRGVLAFDGVSWAMVPTSDFPHVLVKMPQTGTVLVGCKNGFGYLTKDDRGQMHFNPILDKDPRLGDITHIEVTESHAYFCSSRNVTSVHLSDFKVDDQWRMNDPFTGFIQYNGTLFINVDQSGLHQIKNHELVPVQGGEALADLEILFDVEYDELHSLFGADDNRLYLFDGKRITHFKVPFEGYLNESVVSTGTTLSENIIALATLSGGCILFNKNSRKAIYTMNYQTGLPDDEIFAIGSDMNGGLWLSHEFGISRVELSLPIRSFDSYPGLEGNLISCIEFDSILYVSTSEGLFYLSEVSNYAELQNIIKKPVERAEPTIPEEIMEEVQPTEVKTTVADTVSTNDDLTWQDKWRLRREERKNKKRNNDNNEEAVADAVEIPEETPSETVEESAQPEITKPTAAPQTNPTVQPETTNEPETIYALQSISHIFKKVVDLEKKCKQIMPFKDRLLVATNTGLYEVKDQKSRLIVGERYINFITSSTVPNRVFVGTSNGLLVINFDGQNWTQQNSYDGFEHSIYSIVENDPTHLWLGSENQAFLVPIDENGTAVSGTKTYNFANDYSEQVLIRKVLGQTFFFLSSGIYTYNSDNDSIDFSAALNKSFMPNSKYIISQQNITWIYNTSEWIALYDHSDLNPNKKIFLELFDDVKNIYVDAEKNIWVIERNNRLYKILDANNEEQNHPFNIYIRGVLSDTGYSYALNNIVLDFENNSLEFNIAAPYYIKANSVEYQYYVEGLMRDWSRWTDNASIDLPYLPSGKYTMRVRARNVLGKETEEKSLSFEVIAPFWEANWFWLACIVVGLLLIWFAVKLRVNALKRKQAILEKRVRIRTNQLREEKTKVEELLLNILPAKVADELTRNGKAQPKHYNLASVLFTDFKGFTGISESISPEELIKTLDECFGKFDEIVTKWQVEKIKTIGDAYMCASGLPDQNEFHPVLVTLAAMEIRDYMLALKAQKEASGDPIWELRLGIHTGSLIAGVVGKKKFAYDIWGDTVNTAARLESSSEAGKINISGATYEFVSRYFECTQRGKIEAKSKGKIDMYFVDSIKPEYSVNGEGKVPNEKFIEMLGVNNRRPTHKLF